MKILGFFKKLLVMGLAMWIAGSITSCSFYGPTGEDEESRLSLSTLNVPALGEAEAEKNDIPLPSLFTVISEKENAEGFFASPDESDIFSRTVFERNSRLYTEYGVTVEHKTVGELASYAKNAYLTGSPDYNMLLTDAEDAALLISTSALADLASVAGFSENAKGYSAGVIEGLSVGGRIYLTAGDATPSLIRNAAAVMVNTDLLSRIEGGEELMRTVKSGKFTYETMLKLSLALKELNGSDGDSAYGIKAGAEDALSLFFGGGGSFYTTDKVTDMPAAVDFSKGNRAIYASLMKLYGYDIESEGGVAYGSTSKAATPLFTISNVGRVEALAIENAPFKALPMPKYSESQSSYISNVDTSSVIFTAIPAGTESAANAAVMNLIYSISDGVTRIITDNCDGIGIASNTSSKATGTVTIIKNSLSASLLTVFDYADMPQLLSEGVSLRLSGKAFEMRGTERSRAAAMALSIMISSLD